VDGDLNNNEKKLLFWWAMMLLLILGIITTIVGCNSGWSVANLEITPSNNQDTLYIIIVDQDSTIHWYNNSIYVEENYCYKHHIWENVRKKNSE